jgi:uncharacterized protein YndB with AHSA1/START domain
MVAWWGPVEARREMAADPSAVYEVIADPTTYPEWLVGAQRIRAVDPRFPKPGTEFEHSVGPAQAVTVDDATEATGADPPHRLDLHVRAGIFHADVRLLVDPAGTGTEVRFLERPTGPWVTITPLLRPVLRARNAESLRRLSGYVEALRGTAPA